MSDETKEKLTADPRILGVDIAYIFIQTSNQKKLLYRTIMTRSLTPDVFLDFIESFYGLWDRTSHFVKAEGLSQFFEDVYVWESDQDDEEDFQDELMRKSKEAMSRFDFYRETLKDAGILDLVRAATFEGADRD